MSMFDQLINVNELIEAGIGFNIIDEDLPESSFQIVIREEPAEFDPPVDTMNCYWTMSGNNPVVHDQAYQADQVRSAGGWSDITAEDDEDFQVRNGLEPVIDYGPMSEWSDFRLYLKHKKEERQDRAIAIFDWLRKQTHSGSLKHHWKRFRMRVRESRKKCAKYGDWLDVFLTSQQVKNLETYFLVRLKILSK